MADYFPPTRSRSTNTSPVRPQSSYSVASTIRRVTPSPDTLSGAVQSNRAINSSPARRNSSASFSQTWSPAPNTTLAQPQSNIPHSQSYTSISPTRLPSPLRRQPRAISPPKRKPVTASSNIPQPRPLSMPAPSQQPIDTMDMRNAPMDIPQTPSPMSAEQRRSAYQPLGMDGNEDLDYFTQGHAKDQSRSPNTGPPGQYSPTRKRSGAIGEADRDGHWNAFGLADKDVDTMEPGTSISTSGSPPHLPKAPYGVVPGHGHGHASRPHEQHSTPSSTSKLPRVKSKSKLKPAPIHIPPTDLDPYYNLGYGYGSRKNSLEIPKARDATHPIHSPYTAHTNANANPNANAASNAVSMPHPNLANADWTPNSNPPLNQTRNANRDRDRNLHTPTAYRDDSDANSDLSPEPFGGARNVRELEEQRRNVSVGTKASAGVGGKKDKRGEEGGCCGCLVM
ncbi:hypothetical protein K491DRAFT_778206 [Lophiostoma macrostomum CBS 122681]|uniref:Uncharacterized protein n=1 Tax=Lophiostoma macrostomum CBS 122681 TaxID=1314788 RepID=A0A6A6TAG8_9PLEO|nr:hypothetical protein K491DRAFT_778206 [Lophiostoma macrostomum CBS 122681]